MAVASRDRSLSGQATSLWAAAPLSSADALTVRHRMIFECCKWDPQFGDRSVLASFPLVIDEAEWSRLAASAEQLAAETAAAEQEIIRRPSLFARLGLPRPVTRALAAISRLGPPREVARVIRFDFHLCHDGWRISEANTDVPGGFIEAAGLSRLMAEHYPDCRPAGDPAAAYADALANAVGTPAAIALIHATAYSDDRQVMVFLSRHLQERGLRPYLASPADLRWDAQRASLQIEVRRESLSAIVRFFPGEWLPNLPGACGWTWLFAGGHTPLSNPATALVTQSKRFPLIWDELATPLRAWRSLLPETRSPSDVDWRGDEAWVLKPALGRVGDGIGLRGATPQRQWRQIARDAFWRPHDWVAQRRFEAIPIETSDGPRYPVLGIFTINGRAAGIYGRLASRPLIDCKAQDVAVLVQEDHECP